MLLQIPSEVKELSQNLAADEKILSMVFDFSIKLATGLVILVVGFWLANRVTKLLLRLMKKREVDETLRPFVRTFVNITLKTMVLVIVISTLGVAMTSIIAVLGSIGLAIGLALQGSLSNVAGGVMLLLLKPFKKGDFIKVQGETGTVEEISIHSTKLRTIDNKIVFVPNGPLASGTITNITHEPTRRVDMSFGISYGDDFYRAQESLKKIVRDCPLALKDPEPIIRLEALADSSVNIAVRVWTETENYWEVFFYLNETVKATFDREDITIPFPQRDVYLHPVQGGNA